MRLPLIGEVTGSVAASAAYSFISLVIFIIVCFYGWKRLKERADAEEVHGIKKYTSWVSLVWKMKSIYLSALVHIYDVCTDVGIIVQWMGAALEERKDYKENNVRGIDMMALFVFSIVAFFLYRFVSAGFVYEFTGKWKRACIQFLDLEIYHAIYITHKLGREEAGNLQRWLQKFEAIFESAPQSLLQIVYIIKTGDRGFLIMSSIALSFFSVAARFTSDDRIFFVKDAERLGLKYQRRFPKKKKPQHESHKHDDADSDSEAEDDEEILNQTDLHHPPSTKGEASRSVTPSEPKEDREASLQDTNPNIQIKRYEPTFINFRYDHGSDGPDGSVITCRAQTAKLNKNKKDVLHWNTRTVHYAPRSNQYSIKGLEPATEYVLRLSFRAEAAEQGKWTDWTENTLFTTPYFTGWTIWNYIGFNRAYLFRYSFRMCDVFSRLMILALVWCVLSGKTAFAILMFEIVTVVFYAQQIKKYNFFQFLVATYFSEDNREQTVSYCFFRRIESLVYLIIVSWVVLFDKAYNDDATIDCVDTYANDPDDALKLCMADLADPSDTCDCMLQNEVYSTKLLLLLAWSFANLSGDVFFGAFNSMRDKFGTNERNIVNVMLKRDWEAFSEMLQFGYRMNRFDDKSQRSGLSTFLDRVPSDRFQYEEVENMIKLGADINDQSVRPKNEEDHDEPNKVGDNVFIRYIKVTPCQRIDAEFDDVVKKWTKIGVTGGSYSQTKDRICVNINAKNAQGYTAFQIYWEKMQYVRREKLKEKRHINYRRRCHKIENEYDEKEKEANPTPRIDKDEANLNKWFHSFYDHILKWEELGADMSTVSEDGVSSLLTYVTDIENENIDMGIIKRLCPIDGKSLDQEEEKYESIEMDTDHLVKRAFFVDKTTRQSAFREWYKAHDFEKKLFDVADIQIWYDLGATDEIQTLDVLKTYFRKCDVKDQKKEDIDVLINCGCSVANKDAEQFPSKDSFPRATIVDTIFRLGKVNLDIVEHLVDVHHVDVETNNNPNWQDVTDPHRYGTQLRTYLCSNEELTVNNIRKLIKRGYLLTRKGTKTRAQSQSFVSEAVYNSKLPFDVFLFLLDAVEPAEDDTENNDTIQGEGTLDWVIFARWILNNEQITFDQIETLISKYKFSPYQSTSNECAIHYIWKNSATSFDVMHRLWLEYGQSKFGKFKDVFIGFLWHILTNRKMEKKEEIQKLEIIFKDYVGAIDEATGNGWLHRYCENKQLEMEVLQYLCSKCEDQLFTANKNGFKPLHILCQNESLKIEHLEYFVVQLNIPMTLTNEAGFQPFQALHYLVDNKQVKWKKKDVEIMIHKLNIDFETFRAGEVILYRLSKQSNITTEALIYLYSYYKDEFEVDLNSLRSAKKMWVQDAGAGGTTLLLHLMKRPITPYQIRRLADKHFIGLDIKAKNDDNKTVLHALAERNVSHHVLRTVCELLKDEYGDEFAVDTPNKWGITPFQIWLKKAGKMAYKPDTMVTFDVWEELGADITQNESGAGYNMLHHYTSVNPNMLRLSYFRKLCFDDENPWLREEQTNKSSEQPKRVRSAFQVPLHARPVPNNRTLYDIYVTGAVADNQPVQIRVLEYFASKKNEGVRAILDTTSSPLWIYMRHKYIDLNVVKYMVETMGYSVRPSPSDLILFDYLKYLPNRDAIDWDLLDYFYEMTDSDGNKVMDFTSKEKDYITLLHKYCVQLSADDLKRERLRKRKMRWGKVDEKRFSRKPVLPLHSLMFNCSEFKTLIDRYDLQSILKDENGANPTPAAHFYEHRANEIRPDIIQCFTELGFDINEQVNGKTPLQHYCSARNTYVMKSILCSFIDDGKANVNDRIPGQQAPFMSQVLATTVPTKVLKMMIETFGVELVNAKKRTQDLWYTFLDNYGTIFTSFEALLSIYIKQKFEPIHLFHSDQKDGDKKIQYKLYRVSTDGINMKEEEEKNPDFQLKKNRKNLKIAKKYVGRIVFVVDARDALFRSIRVIDPRCIDEKQPQFVPTKWLRPLRYTEMIDEMDELLAIWKSCWRSTPGQSFAKSLVIIDMDTIRAIQDLISKCAVTDHEGKPQTMNAITLKDENTILTRYIITNHMEDIKSSDIDEMKTYGIDFERKNDEDMNALHLYCELCKGVLNKNVIQSLVKGGCPINWGYGPKDDDDEVDDDGGDEKRETVRGDFAPLHCYCQLPESNLKGFKILVECGADIYLESKENITPIDLLWKESHHINEAFIVYLVNECKVNLSGRMLDGWSFFNSFVASNPRITRETVTALCDIAGCDANSRDDENDTNSLISYLLNESGTFDLDIVKCLVELGANINEPDNDGKYPIHYALQIHFTPLATLMKYAQIMVECGARLQHILPDDALNIEDNKLYILQQMKDGYEMYNGMWCRIEGWSWGKKKKQKLQSAIALDQFGATKLFITIERQNLSDITQEILIDQYKEFASVSVHEEDEEDVEQEEHKEKEHGKTMHHDVAEENPVTDMRI